ADNEASWALFRSFARDMGAEIEHHEHFEKDTHFGGKHDSEFLLRIGPFTQKP
ncbi:MAG TPA: diaminobutyrate acetyltransferase, partial [Marinobacter sp.]|nr:diaminobutyrate acetyltransferase [Marinobacter sp.]